MMSDTTLSRPEVVSGHTDVIYSTSVCHILAVRKSTLLPIDTIIVTIEGWTGPSSVHSVRETG